MIKIASITNCHIWDGVEMSLHDFVTLLEMLKYSKFYHTVSYYEDEELKVNVIGRLP